MGGDSQRRIVAAVVLLAASLAAARADGPDDRVKTDPRSVQSLPAGRIVPVSAEEVASSASIGDVSLSRDGRLIAYISDASGVPNLWTLPSDGSLPPTQVVESGETQSSPLVSPDASEVIYAQDRGGDELYDLYAVSLRTRTIRNLTASADASEYQPLLSPDGRRLVFIRKAKGSPTPDLATLAWPVGGKITALTHEANPKANWAPVAFSADSRFLFANRITAIDDSDVYRIELASGRQENLTAHTGRFRILATDVSPDGHHLLITSSEQGGYSNVAVLDLATHARDWITHTQWEATSGTYAPGGKVFYYTKNADGRSTVHFVRADTHAEEHWPMPPGLNEAAAYPRSFLPGNRFLFRHQDSTHPANLLVAGLNRRPAQLTHHESQALASATLPASQVVTYASFDGRLISAFLWMPFNLKREHAAPAVLLPHGGPTDQTVDEFNRRAVMLVSRGFVVLAPNVRGSTGYGAEFKMANVKDLGNADLKDEIAGLDFLKASGYIDERHVGIWGGSYGGFMVLMALSKFPDLWAAGVDEYGILDWKAMLERSEPELQEYEKSLLGDPVTDAAVYERSSPLAYVHHLAAPLLVLQGDRDIRVPREEADNLVALLKADHRTVESVLYPGEGHGFAKRATRIDELTRAAGWFEKYLQAPR